MYDASNNLENLTKLQLKLTDVKTLVIWTPRQYKVRSLLTRYDCTPVSQTSTLYRFEDSDISYAL